MSDSSTTQGFDEFSHQRLLESVIADYIRACDGGATPTPLAIDLRPRGLVPTERMTDRQSGRMIEQRWNRGSPWGKPHGELLCVMVELG